MRNWFRGSVAAVTAPTAMLTAVPTKEGMSFAVMLDGVLLAMLVAMLYSLLALRRRQQTSMR